VCCGGRMVEDFEVNSLPLLLGFVCEPCEARATTPVLPKNGNT